VKSKRLSNQSAKRLIVSKIQSMGIGSMFRILNDRIETPGGGLIIFQGTQDQKAESIKSLEGFQIAWVEESQTLSHRLHFFVRPSELKAPRFGSSGIPVARLMQLMISSARRSLTMPSL
jgi:phage terminase large subunit